MNRTPKERVPSIALDRHRVVVVHPGAEMYGSDRVALESVTAMIDGGAEVTVVLPGEGALSDEMELLGAEICICPMPVLRKSALRPRGALQLLSDTIRSTGRSWGLLRGARPDVVYVSTMTVPSWVLLSRLARVPVVVHVHEAERSQPRWIRTLMALPLLLAQVVVVNSQFSRDTLAASVRSVGRRSQVLLNGVPGPPALVWARHELDTAVKLLFVGRLSSRKGPQTAVDVLVEVVANGMDARLDLLGSVYPGNEQFEAELRRHVHEQGMDDRVRFMGFRHDIWQYVAQADIVLIPSLVDEPFGNTAVEAVLAARPVVVSRSGGLMEAVTAVSSARLADPGDVEQWAQAVIEIVNDWPTLRRQAILDSSSAADRYSTVRYRHAVLDVVARAARPQTSGGGS